MSDSRVSKQVVVVNNVTKSFRISLDGSMNIKQKILNIFKGSKGYRVFKPLDRISFDVKEGDFFGIVGRNGSGKSTLLKTIAGIYTPDGGNIKINGRLVPFIELGVGFNPELSGRENVYLNCALLGFSRKETSLMYNEIVDFAELHDFMEENLKNYSSGMQVRLAFSIAIRAKGDILLLDEVLAVGDSAFQQKCYDYFEKLKKEKRTIILVTHSMESVKRFCNKALLLESGKIKLIGNPDLVADQYTIDNISSKSSSSDGESEQNTIKHIKSYLNKNGFTRNDTLRVNVECELDRETDVIFGIAITKDGKSIAELNSKDVEIKAKPSIKLRAHLDIDLSYFTQGAYSYNVAIFSRDNMAMIGFIPHIDTFFINGTDQTRGGAVYIKGPWVKD